MVFIGAFSRPSAFYVVTRDERKMTDIYPDDIRVEGENLALKRVLWGIIAVCVVAVLNGISLWRGNEKEVECNDK